MTTKLEPLWPDVLFWVLVVGLILVGLFVPGCVAPRGKHLMRWREGEVRWTCGQDVTCVWLPDPKLATDLEPRGTFVCEPRDFNVTLHGCDAGTPADAGQPSLEWQPTMLGWR